MTSAARKGDKTTGPSNHPWMQAPAIEGSPNVIINGKPAVRVGDHFASHSLPFPPIMPHDSVAAQGSKTVFVNGKALSRIGDQTSCSDIIAEGSPNVIVGDGQ